MIDISATIVIYNDYEKVKVTIESIEKYTASNLSKKVFVVDNSEQAYFSENGAGDKFADWLKQYNDVEYIYTGKNLGFSKGHNYVLDKLDSRFHAIVNPDIEFKEDVFSEIAEFMDDETVGMCIPRITDKDGNLQRVYRKEITIFDVGIRMFFSKLFKKRQAKHTMQDQDYTKPFQVPFGQGSFLVIRTDLFKQLNGFDERFFLYLEDADLCKRVNEVSKLMYCPYANVIHIPEKGSHKNIKLFIIHLKSMRKYFKKWGYNLFN